MSAPAPCECGGYADLRGGLVSMLHWVECRVCKASTGLCHGLSEALDAWRHQRLKSPVRPVATLDELATLRAEVERLREALAIHQKADDLRRNGWRPWNEWLDVSPKLDALHAARAALAKEPPHE